MNWKATVVTRAKRRSTGALLLPSCLPYEFPAPGSAGVQADCHCATVSSR